MYQALYRKYRPSNFNDVVGQQIVVTTLKNSIKNNKIGHAYLFSGPRGTGKTSIAKIFAKTINCINNIDGISCEKCEMCMNDENLDIIEIDAASNNGIDEIREIKNKVNLSPSIGKFKIYIIDEVHMLTTGAFNALLKTLEEPPSHAIFILATTESQKIPATILSRCQKFDFKKISNADIKERLLKISNMENIDITNDSIDEIINNSDGALRDAINLLDQVSSFKNEKIIIDDVKNITGNVSNENILQLVNYMADNNLSEIYKTVESFYDDGKDTKKICNSLLQFIKNCLLNKIGIKEELISKYTYFSNYNNISIIEIINKLNSEINNIEKSDDKKLALFIILLDLSKYFDQKITDNNDVNEKSEILNALNVNVKKEHIVENNINNPINISEIVEEKNETNNICNDNIQDSLNNKTYVDIKEDNMNESMNTVEIKNDDEFKMVRIDNTLSEFSRRYLIEIKNKLDNMDADIFDQENYDVITILKDGVLKAASDKYLMFMYKTELTSQNFNNNVEKYEKYLLNKLNIKTRVISICESEWDVLKTEFNNKTRPFIYREEEK